MTSLVPFFPQPEFLVDNTLCPHSLTGCPLSDERHTCDQRHNRAPGFPYFWRSSHIVVFVVVEKNPLSRGCKAFLWSHFSDDNAGEWASARAFPGARALSVCLIRPSSFWLGFRERSLGTLFMVSSLSLSFCGSPIRATKGFLFFPVWVYWLSC